MKLYRSTMEKEDHGEGSCWSDDKEAAASYDGNFLLTGEYNGEVVDVDGYDRNKNETPADSYRFRSVFRTAGAKMLRYQDEDVRGREMVTFRTLAPGVVKKIVAKKHPRA